MPSLPAPLRRQSAVQMPFQASKWLKYPILLDLSEMELLLQDLGEFWIFQTSIVTPINQEILSRQDFLTAYQSYVESLKKGMMPDLQALRPPFSSVLSRTSEALYAVPISEHEQLVKICKPVIQLQPHQFAYSPVDGKFHSMVWGSESITWGIQFSYPQLYQDEELQVFKVDDSPRFPNTSLFRLLQKWIRYHTIATPFLVNSRQINVPIRIGKDCLKWIHTHPQLKSKGLEILKP